MSELTPWQEREVRALLDSLEQPTPSVTEIDCELSPRAAALLYSCALTLAEELTRGTIPLERCSELADELKRFARMIGAQL